MRKNQLRPVRLVVLTLLLAASVAVAAPAGLRSGSAERLDDTGWGAPARQPAAGPSAAAPGVAPASDVARI
ncbi:hypothetical protein [Streptomyces qinglanensis]|uniref:hypothetical protein n=1 Tax=Streptomyces qinglanensis TaxID=943816 RepID=UPI003D74EA07